MCNGLNFILDHRSFYTRLRNLSSKSVCQLVITHPTYDDEILLRKPPRISNFNARISRLSALDVRLSTICLPTFLSDKSKLSCISFTNLLFKPAFFCLFNNSSNCLAVTIAGLMISFKIFRFSW